MNEKNYARGLRVTLEIPQGWDKNRFLQIVLTPCKLRDGTGPVFDIPGAQTVLVSGIAQFALCRYPVEDFFIDQVSVPGQKPFASIAQIIAYEKQVLNYVCDACFEDDPNLSETDIVINKPIPKGFSMEKLARYMEVNPFSVVADITPFC